LDAYVSYFRPASPVELRLVQKLTNADWRHERGVLMETSLYNMGAAELREETAERDAISQFTEAWKASCKKDSNSFDLLRRYSATLQTQFDKTLAALLKLEKRRPNAEPHAAPVNEQPAKIDPALDITVPVESLPSGKPQVAKQNPYPPRIPIALFPIEPGPVKKVNYVSKLPKPPLPKAA
jgi:hypothetical protein